MDGYHQKLLHHSPSHLGYELTLRHSGVVPSKIVTALDTREADRFWARADDAAAWRASLSPAERQRLIDAEAEVDRAFDGIE